MSFKLLHASDLHLGQRFHEQDRSEDEAFALRAVVNYCRDREVDVVVLAGDIFDTANPGAGEVARYNRFLAELVLEAKVATVVVIAGNHDSAVRIEGPKELYQLCKIHVIGSLRCDENPKKCLIPLLDRRGNCVAQCMAIPYLRDADVRMPASGEEVAASARAHVIAVDQRLRQIRALVSKELPLVTVGHAFCAGSIADGGERPVQVGNLGLIPAHTFGEDSSYLAMGHLHQAQILAGRAHWRYAGSLLPTGFDGTESQRKVLIATISGLEAAQVEECPVPTLRRYHKISGSLETAREQVLQLPIPAQNEAQPWLCISIIDTQSECSLSSGLEPLVSGKGWHLTKLLLTRKRPEQEDSPKDPQVSDFDNPLLNPDEVFLRLLKKNSVPEASQANLLHSFRRLRENCEAILHGQPSSK